MRFDKNKAAIETLIRLQEEGREATPEEQRVLAGYTGWGSFGQELFQGTFDYPREKPGWEERGKWLREHLGREGWQSAQRSIINAHYTDPPTVMAMWEMLRRMGFNGGRVLEPAMGIGNFFGLMPKDLKERSQLTGIELDTTTGEMAKLLYPQANISIMGYEKSRTPDDTYDVVIGNWPFADIHPADRRYMKINPTLHDYFFLKALDQVKPGGIVIGITSAGTMDKKGFETRKALAKKAELVSSIRLPSGAFEGYAGTSVVTDIIVLKKRAQPINDVSGEGWIRSVETQTPQGTPIYVNEYYAKNPQNVLGTLDFGHGSTYGRAAMIVHRPADLEQRLQNAITELVPEGVFAVWQQRAERMSYIANFEKEPDGVLFEKDGVFYLSRGEQAQPAHEVKKFPVTQRAKVAKLEAGLRDAIKMRRAYTALLDAERQGGGKAADKARAALRAAYENYAKKHGGKDYAKSAPLEYLRGVDDPFYYPLAALEIDGKPAPILTESTMRGKRVVDKPTVQDAYVLARGQAVEPTLKEIADIAGKSEDEVREQLVASGAVFETPSGGIAPADIYLSGNVRHKLREAQVALQEGNEAMQRNVDELQKALPPDIGYSDIEVQFGANWVPADVYKQYILHMLQMDGRPDLLAGIHVTPIGGRWKVHLADNLNKSQTARTGYGSAHKRFADLVQAAFDNRAPVVNMTVEVDGKKTTVQDIEATEEVQERVARIRADFAEWMWSDQVRRAEMEREYNETRNIYAIPRYDGSFLSFEGMALKLGDKPFNLRQHQANAIWRAIVNRRSMNAHEVGTGKTFTMAGIAVESRRYGIAKKPLILAHNANSASVAADIRKMYPAAKVLFIEKLSEKSLKADFARITNGDWDAVVLPHSAIAQLTMSEETLWRLAKEDIESLESRIYAEAEKEGVDLSAADLDGDPKELAKALKKVPSAKQMVKTRQKLIESTQQQALKASKEGAVTFEQLGVDMLLIDEVHAFKKPPIETDMNMKGLNTETSGRATQLHYMSRYIHELNGGGGVHTFSGTMITNTLSELYAQMRYVMADEMKTGGVDGWDGWFAAFAKEIDEVVLNSVGSYEAQTRLGGFVNMPELRRLAGQYMDIVYADDMPEMKPRTVNGKVFSDATLTDAERDELLNGYTENPEGRPYKKIVNVTVEMTDMQKAIFAMLQQRKAEWDKMQKKEKRDAMLAGDKRAPLAIEDAAAKAGFDERLFGEDDEGNSPYYKQEGSAELDESSKIARLVANVKEIYDSDQRAAQVIFSDKYYSRSGTRSGGTDESGEKRARRTVHKFSSMLDVVERLVQAGIPREEIVIVDGEVTPEKRREIADAVNALKVRVVIGGTQTLGVGVNMQQNMRAMHHLDAPYMPGDLEQRNGRGHRQGNHWNTVLEYRYLADRLDGKRWQYLAIKQRFINEFMRGDDSKRHLEDEDASNDDQSGIMESFSEAAGDPRILLVKKLQKDVEKLRRAERVHTRGVSDAVSEEKRLRAAVQTNRQALAEMTADNLPEKVAQMMRAQSAGFEMEVGGRTYDARKDAGEALAATLKNMRFDTEKVVGHYRGHEVKAEWKYRPSDRNPGAKLVVSIGGQEFISESLTGLEMQLRGYGQRVEKARERINQMEADIERMQTIQRTPWSRAADLARTQERLAEIEADRLRNPVAPPIWLRQGAPVGSEAYQGGEMFVVTGHRWAQDGWYVLTEQQGEDGKAQERAIPYTQVTDEHGMPLYEEREFEEPVVQRKEEAPPEAQPQEAGEEAAAQEGEGEVRYSRAGQTGQTRRAAPRGAPRAASTNKAEVQAAERLQRALTRSMGEAVDVRAVVPDAAQKGAARFAERLFGRKVVFFESRHAGAPEGAFMIGRVLYVNANAANPAQIVMGHELWHSIAREHPQLARQVEAALRAIGVRNFGGYARTLGWAYTRDGLGKLDGKLVNEEFTADVFGHMLGDPQMLRELAARTEPNTFKRLVLQAWAFLNRVLRRAQADAFLSANVGDVEAARRVVLDALEIAAADAGRVSVARIGQAALRLKQSAYHGGGAGIEREGFRLNKIGTGEGAQYFGWGMYFASRQKIAGHYYKQYQENHPERDAAIYGLQIPDDEDLLFWDAPLSRGSLKVERAVQRALALHGMNLADLARRIYPDAKGSAASVLTGRDIYNALMGKAREAIRVPRTRDLARAMRLSNRADSVAQRSASEDLYSVGIPGLRYLDEASRGKSAGSQNYVIWDESLLTPEAAAISVLDSAQAAQFEAEIDGLRYQQRGQDGAPDEAARAAAEREFNETEKAYGGKKAYEAAKKAGKTKLNYQQWVQVRTPSFKRWFGDWELRSKDFAIVDVKPAPFSSLKAALVWARENGILKKMTNEETGGKGEIRISRGAIEEMLNPNQRAKSVSDGVHYAALTRIRDIIRESAIVDSHPDYKKDKDGNRTPQAGVNEGVSIDVLYGAMSLDGDVYRVRATVKRFADTNTADKAHAYSVEKIEVLAGTLVHDEDATNPSASTPAHILLDGVRKVNQETGEKGALVLQDVSKVVDEETGEPLVVYHGTYVREEARDRPGVTPGDITSFDREFVKKGVSMDTVGSWFSTNPGEGGAEMYSGDGKNGGSVIYPVFLNIRNPLTTTFEAMWRTGLRLTGKKYIPEQPSSVEGYREWRANLPGTAEVDAYRAWLAKMGKDGIRIEDDGSEESSEFSKQTAIIALEPNQIKSATGNIGTFDADDTDIRFSLRGQDATPEQRADALRYGGAGTATQARMGLLQSGLAQLSNIFRHEGRVSLWDKTVGTPRHLAERVPAFKPVYESAQQSVEDKAMLANDAAERAKRWIPQMDSWRDIGKQAVSAKDSKAVAKPLFEGTLMWVRDGGRLVRLDDLEEQYSSLSTYDKERLLKLRGKMTEEEMERLRANPLFAGPDGLMRYEKAIDNRFQKEMMTAGVVFTDAELRKHFGLNDEQISLYREARAAIDRSLDMTARADMMRVAGGRYAHLREQVLNAETLDDARDVLLNAIRADKDAEEDGTARDQLSELWSDINVRAAKVSDLQSKGYAPLSRFGRYVLDVVDNETGERVYFGMYETRRESNLARMKLAQEFPNATVTQGTLSQDQFQLFQGVSPETAQQFGEMLGLSDKGNRPEDIAFQRYLQLAKNNNSALRRLIHRKGIAGYSEDVGRVLASFIYSNASAGSMGLNGGKMEAAIMDIPKEHGELRDVAIGLREYMRNPREGGQIVRGFLFAQYLGGSIASALVNSTQPFQVTLPWLSQFGGMANAAKHLMGAIKDMPKGNYEKDLAAALKAAEDDGVVSPQEIHQLMAQARGVGSLSSGDGTKLGAARATAGNLWQKTKVLWGQPFALAEQFNRRSSFIAAYRLARERGMANPAEFARRAVEETQFVYSKANKPVWARGTIGGALFTFKTYSVSYLEVMHRMWTQGGKEGKRAVAWSVAMLLLVGGAGGLPFMEDAEDLIDGAGQLMGYNVSTKHWRDDFLRKTLGEELGSFLESGASALPGMPIDVSGRLGMGNLVPGTGLMLAKQSRESDLKEMAGAAGDFLTRVYRGGKMALSGNVGGGALEMAPNAVRNFVKGIDMANHGMYRDAKGYKVVDTKASEALAKGIGFQPASVARIQDANSFMQRSKSFYQQKATEIRLAWAQALFEKDETKLARVRQRLADWNRKNPDQRITVDMRAVWKRVREMSKDRSQRIADTSPKALRRQMRELAAEARGEAV